MSWPVLVLAPEDAGDEAAVLDEPARRDGGAEDAGDEPGTQPGQEPEQQHQLPDLADQAGRDERDARDQPGWSARPSGRRCGRSSQPLSGPDRPKTTRPAAAANDTDAVDQPGSVVIDRRNAPGADRTPAVTSTTTAVTATTTQP